LHWLFLDAINEDLSLWVDTWNSHKITLRGEPNRSPRDMYLFGMVEHGPRGIRHLLTSPPEIDEEDLEDPAIFGIDTEIGEDPTLLRHFLENNPEEDWPANDVDRSQNPFDIEGVPWSLSEVTCEVDDVSLPVGFVQELQLRLLVNPELSFTSQDMTVRRLLWENTLQICADLSNEMDGLLE
jgi:hypothetical protein